MAWEEEALLFLGLFKVQRIINIRNFLFYIAVSGILILSYLKRFSLWFDLILTVSVILLLLVTLCHVE